jgi:hypothetical protein
VSIIPLVAVALIVGTLGLSVLSRTDVPVVQLSHYTGGNDILVAGAGARVAPAPQPAAAISAPRPAAGSPTRPGAAAINGALSVIRQPTIDVATIQRVLKQYDSPAAGEAQTIYDMGERYGIDPAVCLAFFIMESSAGTRGMATETLSIGNIRATPGYVDHKGYRKYASWREGIEDWYQLIARLYVGEWGLTTVEAIVPVYAPAADSNDPDHYTNTVRRLVREWSA